MLSRTAEGLFWFSRYLERGDHLCRMAEAARQRLGLIIAPEDAQTYLSPIVAAADFQDTFPPSQPLSFPALIDFLIADPANPRSLAQCFALARENARDQRVYLTHDIWVAMNLTWQETRLLGASAPKGAALTDLLEQIRRHTTGVRGAIECTLLRDSGFQIIEIGKFLERCGATARLLRAQASFFQSDVYVGELRLTQMLQSLGMMSAFRCMYSGNVTAEKVMDVFVYNPLTPRSVRFCMDQTYSRLTALGPYCQSSHALEATWDAINSIDLNETPRADPSAVVKLSQSLMTQADAIAIALANDCGFALPS